MFPLSWHPPPILSAPALSQAFLVGGNVTGVSLYGSDNPLYRLLWDDLQPIGPALGLQFRLFIVSGLDKLPAVFFAINQKGFDAITLLTDAQFFSARQQISNLAAMHRRPAMYE
jgi:hypothetical protein